MLTVRLHGHLEEKFGSEFRFEASSVREVIDALQANFDDFTEEFIKDERAYNILVDYEMQDIGGCVLPVKSDSVIDIVPVILGAGFLKSLGLIIIGSILILASGGAAAGLLAGSSFASTAVGSALVSFIGATGGAVAGVLGATVTAALGWGLALAGVASLLAGPDGPDGGGEQSTSLNQSENIVGQGMPIPIGYGRMLVGSVVLSATSTSSYTKTSKTYTYNNTSSGFWANHIIPVSQPIERDLGPFTAADGFEYPQIPTDYGAGITAAEETIKIQNAERDLGTSTYEIVNYTYSSGSTRPAVAFIPANYNGVYS